MSGISAEPFINSMDEGFTTEIIYLFRFRKKTKLGILMPLSGKTLSERIIFTGKKDFLTGGYFIQHGSERNFYYSPEFFSIDFFSCSTEIPELYLESEEYIIEAKAVADLIKRPPPLTMLEPFYRSEKTETAWTRLGS